MNGDIYNTENKIRYGFHLVRFVALHTEGRNEMVEICDFENPEELKMVYKSLYQKHAKVVTP